jgi:hypothetical protein
MSTSVHIGHIPSPAATLLVSAEDWGVLANGGLNHSGDFAATYTDYFSTRAGQGYNGVYVSVFSFTTMFGGRNGPDSDGTNPFTPGTDPTTAANTVFWGRRDTFLTTAASYGFRVFLNITTPLLASGAFTASWTNTQWTAFGTFLGNRYASQSNIMWMVGDDYWGAQDSGLDALLTALRAAGATQPISIQNYTESSSRKDIYSGGTFSWGTANAQFNFGYSYNVSYDVVEKMGLEASPLPLYYWADGFFLAMGTTGITDVQLMRQMIWWALSSGSKGFQVGDDDVWPWSSTALGQITTKTFYTAVIPAIAAYFRSLSGWENLVADTSSQLVIAGRGTHASAFPGGVGNQYTTNTDSYVTAARTPSGSLAVIYMSHGSTITIDESKMAAGYTATWVDPKTCATSAATPGITYNSTAKGSNSDGQADWVLVLQG